VLFIVTTAYGRDSAFTQGAGEGRDTTVEQETESLLLDTVSLSIFGINLQKDTLLE